VQTIRRPVASAAPVGETLRRPVPSSTLPQLDVPLRGPAPVATTGRLRQPSGPYEAQIIRGTTGREISPLSRQPFGGQRKALEPQTLPMLPMYASPQPLPAPMTAPDSLPAPQDMTTVANLPPSQGITATDSTASPASQTPEATAASSDPVPLQPLPNATVSTETSVAEAPAPAPDASTAASADAPPLAEGTLKVETITEGGITALQEETQISVLPSLPEEVKQSLDKVPSGLRTPREPLPDTKPGRLSVDHATYPDLLREDLDMDAPDAVGMNISIKKAPVEVEGLLQDAYAALEANDLKQAASLYAEVLGIAPRNEDALFALATLYHSQNQTEDALPLYQRLLTINPAHQDGLNNYLALVASLSPEEALQKLAELEARNPDLASIHAQKSVAYARLGKKTEAIEAIQTALRMDPQNTEYRYNFAILLDEAGYYEDAATLYSQLLQTHRSGGQIPGDPTTIQERLTFILSNNS
jgi:Tfp pilus assembly protein PilF